MNPILIDTSTYSDFKRNDPLAVEVVRNAPKLAINATVLGELLTGFMLGSKEQQNRRELDAFLGSPLVLFLPIIEETAQRYAVFEKQLRQAGTPIPVNDIWIAASAVEHGMAVFTRDQHFRHIHGLRVGSTWAELVKA